MNLTKTNWPAGWTPNADAINGDPGGLVRSDNLCIDNTGVLALIQGMTEVGPHFSDYVSDMFSRTYGGTIWYWISLNANATSIFRVNAQFTGLVYMQTPFTGTSSARACFGAAFGKTLVCAGMMRTKDDPTVGPLPLGLMTPNLGSVGGVDGTVEAISSSALEPSGTVVIQEGVDGGSSGMAIVVTLDPTSLEGIGVLTLGSLDTTNIGGEQSQNINNDIFQFLFSLGFPNPSVVNILTVQVLLDPNPSDATGYANYYTYNVDTSILANSLLYGPDVATQITFARSQFTRVGTNGNLNWTTVTGIRVTCQCTAPAKFYAYNFQFIGGSLGQLNGVYNYIQVNVNNNGLYLAMSPPSAPLVAVTPGQTSSSSNINVTVINGAALITAISAEPDPQVNEIWFYRIAATTVGLTSTGASANNSSLSQYYFVGKILGNGGTFLDTEGDDEIIETNIVLNPFLQTLRSADTQNGIQDSIFCICGPIFTRMLYMGASYIYISDSLDPDAVDSRYTLKPSGDPNERNLWLKVIANGSLILATTKDLYEITGTFTPLPSGIIDVTIIPIGDAFPPLSQDCCEAQGGVFYIASDGLRITTGQHSSNVSPQLNFLFQGQNRHNVPPVNVSSGNSARYAITQGNNRVYFTLPLVGGSIRLITYDIINNIYTLRYTDPLILHTDPNGRVFAGYDISSNPNISIGAIYELESQTSGGFYNSDSTLQQGYPITFVTVFDANGQPRNRKDTFTLKLIMDTGGDDVSIYIQQDGFGVTQIGAQEWTLLGNVSTNGLETVYIPLDDVTLGFRYAIRIVDVNYVTIFKLYEMTIEYDPRPEQLDYMRIQPSNLGTISRKRFVNYAFVIDTLGNDITFTPYIDNSNTGIAPSSSVVQTPAKQTYIHYFTQEQLGTDINGILSGGVFEFYGLNTEEIISEKLPVPVKFLVIPANDYGIPNRKRHTSYKFQINTRGANVQFIPIIDGVSYPSFTVNTPTKKTVECFFNDVEGDVKGIDIGGTLQTLANTPFEFYGVITPQTIEQLPNQLEYYVIPNNNFGVAARKRIRTLPIVIDTIGQEVIFTPIVDGIPQGITTTLISNGKTTLYHFFENDVFGTDFGGTLASEGTQFEFYELGQPEGVETLPVPKVYDQLGPVKWDRIAKIFNIRVRIIMNGTTTQMPITVYGDINPTNPTYGGIPYYPRTGSADPTSFTVVPGCDQVYEIQLPKSINTTMCRIILGPTADSFHRYDMQIRVSLSGMESDAQWIPLK